MIGGRRSGLSGRRWRGRRLRMDMLRGKGSAWDSLRVQVLAFGSGMIPQLGLKVLCPSRSTGSGCARVQAEVARGVRVHGASQ